MKLKTLNILFVLLLVFLSRSSFTINVNVKDEVIDSHQTEMWLMIKHRIYIKTSEIKETKYLNLSDKKIVDEDLRFLEPLTKLEILDLTNTKISGKGLKYLKNLKKLWKLYLRGSLINDEGLKYVANLKELRVLHLGSETIVKGKGKLYTTNITDKGIIHLKKLKKLRLLYMLGTKVSVSGAKKLKKYLPNCTIMIKKNYFDIDYYK